MTKITATENTNRIALKTMIQIHKAISNLKLSIANNSSQSNLIKIKRKDNKIKRSRIRDLQAKTLRFSRL